MIKIWKKKVSLVNITPRKQGKPCFQMFCKHLHDEKELFNIWAHRKHSFIQGGVWSGMVHQSATTQTINILCEHLVKTLSVQLLYTVISVTLSIPWTKLWKKLHAKIDVVICLNRELILLLSLNRLWMCWLACIVTLQMCHLNYSKAEPQ